MRTNKMIIKASVAAVASVFAAGALAGSANNMDSTTATHNTYASELTYNTAGPIPVDASTQVTTKLGFGVSNGSTRYIRLALTNGTFATAFTSVYFQPTASTHSAQVVQGGAAGDNYVIFQFVAGSALDPTIDRVSFALPGIAVTSNSSNVTATYQLHETAVSAVAGTTNLYSNSKTIAAFSTGLQFALTPAASTATVADLFKKFNSNKVTKLGTITYGLASTVPYGKTANTAVTLANMVSTANVVIAGDFGAVDTSTNGGLQYGTGTTCGTGTTSATSVNTAKTSATFTTTTGLTAQDICYTVTGTTAVPAQTTTAALTVTAASGSSAASVSAANFGTIARDGASVVALNIPNSANSDVGYVRINNAGSTAGKITGTLYAEDGSVLGTANTVLSASLAANATLVMSVPDLVTAFGVTTWTGRAKLQLIGEVPSAALKVQNLVRTANGTLVSVSSAAPTN